MNAIRIRKTLDSETLHLPELKPFIGKTVEIVVQEEATPSQKVDWDAIFQSFREIKDYDFDAIKDQYECDMRHAEDHLQ